MKAHLTTLSSLFLALAVATPFALAQGATESRINAAGPDFTDSGGDLFEADRAFTLGDAGYLSGQTWSTSVAIAGTTDDTLYQTIRYANQAQDLGTLRYAFDGLASGDYDVTLHFMEPILTTGGRLHDVYLEGVLYVNDLDVFAAAGGLFTAHTETVTVTVNDGRLDVDVIVVTPNQAMVSAIEVVLAAPPPNEPDINASPASVDFGIVTTGSSSDVVVSISNLGPVVLTVTGLSTAGAEFTLVSPPALPFTILAGAPPVDVTVRFSPTAGGGFNDDLVITSDDPDEGTLLVPLQGTGAAPGSGQEFRINAAGTDHVDTSANLFVTDKSFVAGDFGHLNGQTWSTGNSISGTIDDPLYQAMRVANQSVDQGVLSYAFDGLTGGDYDVTLHFMEPFQTTGGRLLDVLLEGVLHIDDLDVHAASGGLYSAHMETTTVNVTDGRLDIDIVSTTGNHSMVAAIEVVLAGPPPNEPDINVSPTSVDFGVVDVGSSGNAIVTVSNVGAVDLVVTAITTSALECTETAPPMPFTIPPGGAPVEITATFAPTAPGTLSCDLTIDSNDPDEATVTVPMQGVGVVPGSGVELRINANGPDYFDLGGILFSADKAFVTGDFGYLTGQPYSTPNPIAGTLDPALYQTIRYANQAVDGGILSYAFDGLASGDYDVILHFMEPFQGAGGRLMDVVLEGTVVHSALDIAAAAGGTFTAYVAKYSITVADGRLDIDIINVSGNQSMISAIEVLEPATHLTFIDIASVAGLGAPHLVAPSCIDPMALVSGGAWGDYDDDGDQDLYFPSYAGPNHLYRNDGDTDADGLPDFTDVGAAAGVDDPNGHSQGAVFIDYDNDGDQDLHVLSRGRWNLYQNRLIEDGPPAAYLDVTTASGLVDPEGGRGQTAAWGDFDQDGFLDVYVTKHAFCFQVLTGPPVAPSLNQDFLFKSNGPDPNGDVTFSDATDRLCGGASSCPQVFGLGFAPGWVDYDNDGDLDLYLVNDDIENEPVTYHNVLWRNDGAGSGWSFTDVSAASGADSSLNGMGLGIADYDHNGWFDFAFSNIGVNELLMSTGGNFMNVAAAAGVDREFTPLGDEPITWGTVFFDYNNDGWEDLFFAAGNINNFTIPQPNAMYENDTLGGFIDISIPSGLNHPGRARHASLIDIDNNGFVDLFVGNVGLPPLLFQNMGAQQGNTNNWLVVTVEGTTSNKDAIGTRITLDTPDGLTHMREIRSGSTHGGGDQRAAFIGMGTNTSGTLTIRWPNGVTQVIGTVAANQYLHYVE